MIDDTESPGRRLAELLDAETYDPYLSSTCGIFEELLEQCSSIVLAMPFEGMDYILDRCLHSAVVVWDWWGIYGNRFNRFGKGPDICADL